LFHELRNAGAGQWSRVLGGTVAIVAGACLLTLASSHQGATQHATSAGVIAALGAALLWGTMYIPYRKAYISGMNPLSFVTLFTFGELGTSIVLAVIFDGGYQNVTAELGKTRPALFWLFLGGFCWVLGDLFQQYAAKYIGIARGIPLSNTNQLWGLAWGALVFGELSGAGAPARFMIITGSVIMACGALAISSAEAPEPEEASWKLAMERECRRYGLDQVQVSAAVQGDDALAKGHPGRRWWELLVALAALAIFIWLASGATRQNLSVNLCWMALLIAASVALLFGCGFLLWKRTRFS